jgi:predicted GIY-YIG superfamily endonuclease
MLMQSSENTKRLHVYVLKLQKNKWYVGVTTKNPEDELAAHKAGKGNSWTKQYKPIAIHFKRDMGELPADRAEMLEDRAMRKYVKEHGADNVRGGYLEGIETQSKKKRRFKFRVPASEGQLLIFVVIEATVIVWLLVQRLPK